MHTVSIPPFHNDSNPPTLAGSQEGSPPSTPPTQVIYHSPTGAGTDGCSPACFWPPVESASPVRRANSAPVAASGENDGPNTPVFRRQVSRTGAGAAASPKAEVLATPEPAHQNPELTLGQYFAYASAFISISEFDQALSLLIKAYSTPQFAPDFETTYDIRALLGHVHYAQALEQFSDGKTKFTDPNFAMPEDISSALCLAFYYRSQPESAVAAYQSFSQVGTWANAVNTSALTAGDNQCDPEKALAAKHLAEFCSYHMAEVAARNLQAIHSAAAQPVAPSTPVRH